MPWNKRDDMSLKQEFLEKALTNSYQISSLCREFDISRKTAYKWIRRFKEEGLCGLEDLSRRPLTSPYRSSDDIVHLILETRSQFPAWGGRKLRQYLLNLGKKTIPCEKTINRILLRHECIEPQESQKRKTFIRFEKEFPNELWQMDFKGHFKVLDAGRCHPLTVLDDHSRYSICIKACASENTENVKTALEEAFSIYGLPNAMTMDNGPPWKGNPPWHLSRLTVWLMRLGIKISHSTPRHPQTQGKDERFHRSLKAEVLKYHQFSNLAEAQERFDEWREIYNNLRPHEGIGLECPISRYKPSLKKFTGKLPAIEYPSEDEVRKVGPCGTINFKGKAYFLGEHLYKEHVGLREVKEGIYDVYFSTTKIQRLNCR
jgi:transposase InsO family protein